MMNSTVATNAGEIWWDKVVTYGTKPLEKSVGVKHNTGMPSVIAMEIGSVGEKFQEYSERLLANDDETMLCGWHHTGGRLSSHC